MNTTARRQARTDEAPRRPRGRPPGRKYPHYIPLKLGDADVARLEALTVKTGDDRATLLRRGLELLAKREGVGR